MVFIQVNEIHVFMMHGKKSYIMNHLHLYSKWPKTGLDAAVGIFDVMIKMKGIAPLYSLNRVDGLWCVGVARPPFTQAGLEAGLGRAGPALQR